MKLLAVTHNYIGSNLSTSLRNEPIEKGENVVIPISGDWLQSTEAIKVLESQAQRRQILEELYADPETLLKAQQPDIVLIYFGMGDDGHIGRASQFGERAVEYSSVREVHIVWPRDITRRRELYLTLGYMWRGGLPMPAVHFAEPTGNATMLRLVNEFLETGTIRDPAEF